MHVVVSPGRHQETPRGVAMPDQSARFASSPRAGGCLIAATNPSRPGRGSITVQPPLSSSDTAFIAPESGPSSIPSRAIDLPSSPSSFRSEFHFFRHLFFPNSFRRKLKQGPILIVINRKGAGCDHLVQGGVPRRILLLPPTTIPLCPRPQLPASKTTARYASIEPTAQTYLPR